MKKLVLLALLCSSFPDVFSQNFHLYSFIDQRLTTQKLDKASIDEMAKHLPELLGISKGEVYSRDPRQYSYEALLTDLNKIQKGDIFVFYFAGEGEGKKGKAEDKQVIYFKDKPVSHNEIIKQVSQKKPRMAILLMEGSSKQALSNEGEYRKDHAGVVSKASAGMLFSAKLSPGDAGMVFYMNATEPPKPAQKNYKTGSYFLSSFINSLYDEMGEPAPKWDNIKMKVSTQVTEFSKNVQTPYGSLHPVK